jgi:hypothetical protein
MFGGEFKPPRINKYIKKEYQNSELKNLPNLRSIETGSKK